MERPVSFIRRLRASFADAGGSSTIVFSVAAAVLVGCAGMAVDYGRAKLALNAVQNNLDAAVLAGVASSVVEKHQIRTAQTYFKRFTEESGADYTAKFAVKKGVLTGSVEATVETSLLRVLDINQMSLKATAAATAEAALEPLCFMAMHPTRKHTLELKGSVSVIAPDCNIYGNSNHEFDVVDPHTPQNFLTAKFVAAIGGGHHYLQNVTPPVEFGTKLVEEPLASLPLPAAPACTATGTSISGKTMTLAPGTIAAA